MSVSGINGTSSMGDGVRLNSSPGSFEELSVSAKVVSELLSSMSNTLLSKDISSTSAGDRMEKMKETVQLNRAIELSRRWPGTSSQEGPSYSDINASGSRSPIGGHGSSTIGTIIDLIA